MQQIDLRIDNLTDEPIRALIREHLASMHANSPPESVHALDIDKLRDPAVMVWSAWIDGQLAGCGALKELGPRDAEVKSMRTREAFRRRGVGTAILSTILREARSRGYERLWLETGSTADFAAAHALYRQAGFTDCGPFGDYRFDPFSRYMKLELSRM